MKYLTIEEVLAIHLQMVNIFGGSHGIRDFGLLHSAISRSQASFAGKDLYPTVFDKTATILHSLLLNHPFLDGNKRTAYTSCARFLFNNGYKLVASHKKIVSFTMNIENKKPSLESISTWLKKHSVPNKFNY